MSEKTLWNHIADTLKAAIAVALMAGIQVFLEYLGAHLSEPATLASLWASGFAAIKANLSRFV